jgi:hypothetical protein
VYYLPDMSFFLQLVTIVCIVVFLLIFSVGSLDAQAKLLQENTDRDEMLAQHTTANHCAVQEELRGVNSLLQTHDRAIADDCVHATAFNEVSHE